VDIRIRHAFHPKGTVNNNYPIVIGGGNNTESATVMILELNNDKLNLKVLNTEGEEFLNKGF
jgi:hypothetical protein